MNPFGILLFSLPCMNLAIAALLFGTIDQATFRSVGFVRLQAVLLVGPLAILVAGAIEPDYLQVALVFAGLCALLSLCMLCVSLLLFFHFRKKDR